VTAVSAAALRPGNPTSNSVTCRARLPRRAALPLHPIQRIAEYARANCAVPRANSVRAGILRAVAGRIIKNAACSDSQSSPAARATANIVAMASVANSSVAFIVCLPTSRHGNRTPATTLNLLIRKGLLRLKRQTDVGTDIRRVAPDAPFAFSAAPRDARLRVRGWVRQVAHTPPLSPHFPSIRYLAGITVIPCAIPFRCKEQKPWAEPEARNRLQRSPYYSDQRSDLPVQHRAIGCVRGSLYSVIFEIRDMHLHLPLSTFETVRPLTFPFCCASRARRSCTAHPRFADSNLCNICGLRSSTLTDG
jgi:hypothetical protein